MKTLFTVNQNEDSIDWEINKELTRLECVALIGLLDVVKEELLYTMQTGDDE